uniref:Uncharacterized protein n=1 Tax=viral metagenome TaxID=1070528 RepID=A0A6M3XYZ8_9ZZZZ
MNEKDKEAQEKIAETMIWYNEPYREWTSLTEREKDMWQARAEDIMKILKELGYCRIDPDKLHNDIDLTLFFLKAHPEANIDVLVQELTETILGEPSVMTLSREY